ncbi:iron-sulfur cluster assembly accessory protein, partial [Peribacillus sp. SIMBA_075]
MTQVVEITEAASFQVKEMMRHNEEEGSFLRVAVKGGGCSGLTYGMGFEPEAS